MNTLTDVPLDLERHEREWLRALQERDFAVLREILHDEFTSTSARSSGEVLHKQDYLSAAEDVRLCDHEMTDLQICPLDGVVVVKGRLKCHSKFQDRDIHDDLLITDVWICDMNRWKALTRHASHVSSSK